MALHGSHSSTTLAVGVFEATIGYLMVSHRDISSLLGFSMVMDLGLYLAVPLLHKKKGKRILGDPFHAMVALVNNIQATMATFDKGLGCPKKEEIYIVCQKPYRNWVKVNSDGFIIAREQVGAGGLIRRRDREWFGRFAIALRPCIILIRELLGILIVSNCSWNLGYHEAILHSDLVVVNWITLCQSRGVTTSSLLYSIYSWLDKEQQLKSNTHFVRQIVALNG
ncbi:hypothetical protein Ancab_002026 [Ancistrocladus abbreviatus]